MQKRRQEEMEVKRRRREDRDAVRQQREGVHCRSLHGPLSAFPMLHEHLKQQVARCHAGYCNPLDSEVPARPARLEGIGKKGRDA